MSEETLKTSLVSIAAELYRLQSVFDKVTSKLDVNDQRKYQSQFAWFSKKVYQALDDVGLRLIGLDGQQYDPGMAVSPLNLDDFETEDSLYIAQTIEPIIMEGDTVIKTGTVVLGRIEK
jgi:kynurenine formamidase